MSNAENSRASSFDWSAALSFVDGDRGLLCDVVEAFLEECPGLMRTMRESIGDSDAVNLRRAAHVMASAMRTFGLPGAVDAAVRLEDLAIQNHLEEAGPYFAELKTCIDDVVPAAIALVGQRE